MTSSIEVVMFAVFYRSINTESVSKPRELGAFPIYENV